jgi:hypothetical protein
MDVNNMTDEQITKAARAICAAQCDRQDNSDGQLYLSGGWDHTVWMRLVEQGIRHGIEVERSGIARWLMGYGERQTADSVMRADHVTTDDRHVLATRISAALREQKQ